MKRSHDYKAILITGASSGLGSALAKQLAQPGTRIVLAARRTERLQKLAEEITATGGQALVETLDVSKPDQTVQAIQRIDEEIGGLDLVVANAGISTQRWSGDLRWQEDLKPLIAVNVEGALATLTAVLPRMVERERGHLVGISSLAQYRGLPRSAAYAASKAFLSTFLESLRIDLRDTGVRVTDVRPGFVKTEMTQGNNFPMPFLMELDAGAKCVAQGIVDKQDVVAFPWQLASLVRSAQWLPNAIYDRAVSRAKS